MQPNSQGNTEGNKKELVCPKCRQFLVKIGGICENEYACFNPECRGMNLDFPHYFGNTQKDLDENIRHME